MANTIATFPMRPAQGEASTGAAPLTVIPLHASEEITDGDVLVVNQTSHHVEDANEATGDTGANKILGVALRKGTGTAAASIDRDAGPGPDTSGTYNTVNVALATPGAMFDGCIIAAGPADHTGAYNEDILIALEILESSDGYACLDVATTTPVTYTFKYVSPQYDYTNSVWSYGAAAGVGLENPRVTFTFLTAATVFATTSTTPHDTSP